MSTKSAAVLVPPMKAVAVSLADLSACMYILYNQCISYVGSRS